MMKSISYVEWIWNSNEVNFLPLYPPKEKSNTNNMMTSSELTSMAFLKTYSEIFFNPILNLISLNITVNHFTKISVDNRQN